MEDFNCGQLGLILDIIGAVLIFISASSGAFSVNFVKILQDAAKESHDEEVKKYEEIVEDNKTAKRKRAAIKPKPYDINKGINNKSIRYEIMSYVGLGFVLIGFALQLVQSFKKII